MAKEKSGQQSAVSGQQDGGPEVGGQKAEAGKAEDGKKAEAIAGELKSCDPRPTAEEMFGRFMVAVAGRPLSVHQPVNEIGDTAERLTAEWLARKDKFATK